MSIQIYQCIDGGTDGRDATIIGHVSNTALAARVTLGRGTFGNGNGKVEPVLVYDHFEELPLELREKILKAEADTVCKATEKAEELSKLLAEAPPEVREAVLSRFREK